MQHQGLFKFAVNVAPSIGEIILDELNYFDHNPMIFKV